MLPKSVKQAVEDHAPWKAAKFEDADVFAIQALAKGNATIHQQKLALDWIVKNACKINDLSYRPGAEGSRDTDFAEGKRYVGLQIVRLIEYKIGARPNSEEG